MNNTPSAKDIGMLNTNVRTIQAIAEYYDIQTTMNRCVRGG